MRVSSEITASFGRLNDITPGQKATVVQKIAPSCCSVVRREMCFPLLKDTTATVDKAVET
jgi:hypothetical protein